MSAIEFDNVTFSYDEQPVLSHVSFTVQTGEFVGLIGPNGGGKSTLLNLLMGFLYPQSGKIRIFNAPPNKVQQNIAYVPQAMPFDRDFPISVMEVVLLGKLNCLSWFGRHGQAAKQEAMEALEKVNLQDYHNRAFGTLSGGQVQRTLIARALISRPKILLLDEPTANVDSETETEIYQMIKDLNSSMTTLMVTHHLQAVINEVGRILCVQNVVTSLEPSEVCHHFAMGLYHPPLMPPKREK